MREMILKKEVNTLYVVQKSSKKEVKDALYRFEKTREELEAKIRDLTSFKVIKTLEEKDVKNKLKKIEKRRKLLNEKEAKFNVDRVQFERFKKENVFSDTNFNVKVEEPAHAVLEVSESSETKSQGPVTSSTTSSSSQVLSQNHKILQLY